MATWPAKHRYTVTIETRPEEEAATARWCGHSHRTIEAAGPCVRRLRRRYPKLAGQGRIGVAVSL